MPDLMKLSHRQVEALLGLSRNSYNWIHGPSTDSTLKALRRMGLVNLSWDDSVAGYMFGCQPCWNITDAGKKRILAMQGTLTEEPEQQFDPSPCRHELGKSDSDRLAEQLETIARLEKELEESEKRGSELAASYCDGVVGDEYGHTYCRYRVERDAVLARPSTAIAAAPTYQFQYREIGESDWTPCDFSRYLYCSKSPEMDTRVVEVNAQTSPAQAEQAESELLKRPDPELEQHLIECDACPTSSGCVEKCMKATAQPSQAPAEAKRPTHECTMGVGGGDGNLFVHGDYASTKAAQQIVLERDAALARVAELEMKLDNSDYAYDNDRIHMRGLAARAIALAKVFDDGGDGADAESARSVVAILRELLAVGGAPAQPNAPHEDRIEDLGLKLHAALARVAELEGKLTDWVREGFRLNEALAVAKSRYGVPEGYALVPVRETEAMHDAVMALLYNGVARTDTQKLLDAYINAATSKESV